MMQVPEKVQGNANDTPLTRFIKAQRIDEMKEINLAGDVRMMESKDLPDVFGLYKAETEKLALYLKYNQAELGHQLLPRDGHVYTFVV